LAKECYSMKLDLLTNATVVHDATRFVSEHCRSKYEINYQKEDDGEEQRITNKVF
jgi:HD superfamily phosphohydrolase YqeK